VYLLKKLQVVAVFFFLVTALAACGGGASPSEPNQNSSNGGQTIKWQLDSNGLVQFFTNDSQWYGYDFWIPYTQTKESQMSTVTATVEKQSGSFNTGFGIIFCYQDSNNFYRLAIDALGHYSVYSKIAGDYTAIISWTSPQTSIINSGVGVSNVISVTQSSPHNFAVSFNGTKETQFTDLAFTGGEAGFAASVSSASETFPNVPEDIRYKLTAPVAYPPDSAGSTTTSINSNTNGGSTGPPAVNPVSLGYLPFQVNFSKSLNKAIIISTNPNALHIVDPKTASDVSVPLPAAVKSMSLSPNGTLAAVLHEGAVSLVDVNLGTLLNSSATNGSQTDAFVSSTGQIYLTGQTGGQWVNPCFTVLNGFNGTVLQTTSCVGQIYGTTKGIYSDLNNMIFTISEGLSPAQIYAISVDPANGNVGTATGSPYWGDYSMSDPFWLSGDQSLLFTAAGTYFQTANLQYRGTFGVPVLSMSQSTTAQEAVVLQGYNHTGNTYPSVYKRFTSSLLFPADDVSLPTIGGLQTYGLYIFHAADDSHVLVVQTGGSQQNPVGASYYLVSVRKPHFSELRDVKNGIRAKND